MKTKTANETAAQSFQAKQTRVAEKLALLSLLVQNETVKFAADGSRNWAAVGTMDNVLAKLTDLTDSLNHTGEYAEIIQRGRVVRVAPVLKTYPVTGRDGKTIQVTIPESEGGR